MQIYVQYYLQTAITKSLFSPSTATVQTKNSLSNPSQVIHFSPGDDPKIGLHFANENFN